MKYLKMVFALVLLASVLAFVAGNTTPVSLRFLLWETPGVSLSLIAAFFFLLGIVFTLLLGVLRRMRRSSKERHKAKDSPEVPLQQPQAAPADAEPPTPGKDDALQ